MARCVLRKIFLAVSVSLLLSGFIGNGCKAQHISLQELERISNDNIKNIDSKVVFAQDHWAYKTLENIVKKHGMLLGNPQETFNGEKPLSREEAAMVLVSLIGKIEQDRTELNKEEQIKIDILKQELSSEIDTLAGKVATVEKSVKKLEGRVSSIEDKSLKAWTQKYGQDFTLNGEMQARYAAAIQNGDNNIPPNFSVPYTGLIFRGKLAEHVRFQSILIPSRTFNSSANSILGDIFASTDIIPHHNLIFGQSRRPIGYEGMIGPASINIETIQKARFVRALSNSRDVGIRAEGKWSFIDYYGYLSNGSGTNSVDNDKSVDLAALLVFKPLYKSPQLGALQLGSGYYNGKSNISNDTMSFFAKYRKNKFLVQSEFVRKDGYKTANTIAEGLYFHSSYFISDKFQLLARYELFDTNKSISKNEINEYTFGLNYYLNGKPVNNGGCNGHYISGNNIKFQLNYVYVDDRNGKNSNKIIAQTQYLF